MSLEKDKPFSFLPVEVEQKEKLFYSKIDEIEQKHLEYFKNRLPYNSQQNGHDKLNKYFLTYYSGGYVTIKFFDELQLDPIITKEVQDAFKEIYC